MQEEVLCMVCPSWLIWNKPRLLDVVCITNTCNEETYYRHRRLNFMLFRIIDKNITAQLVQLTSLLGDYDCMDYVII